jgi:Flp pilus assembly CpaF family ATPase
LRRSFVEGSSTVTLEDSGRFGLFAERLCLERPLTAEQGSLAWLVRCGALPSLVAEQLGQAVRAGRSLVVTGETGSGKSMLLHTLLAEVSAETRSVIVEEDESSWQTRATASPTLARFVPSSALSWEECLQSALALAPDLLVVGELRNWTASLGIRAAARQRGALGAQAALVLELEALKAATKRRGTLANPIRPALLGTVNARDAQGAIRRIAALAAGDDSRQDQSMEEIRTEVRSAIDFIVVMSRNGGQNRVSQVALVFPQTLEILYTREEDGP